MLGAAAMRIAIAPMGKSCTQPSIALDSTAPGMGCELRCKRPNDGQGEIAGHFLNEELQK